MVEEQTVFGGVIDFIARLGFYDVILPFLLTFTIVYAILDKTRILGSEKIGDQEISKRNLNSIVALVMGLLVVFIKPLVLAINQALANIVVLMIIGIFFMVLVGIFLKEGQFELKEHHPRWYAFLIGIMFFGIVLIFLNALRVADGRTWLQVIGGFIKLSWTSSAAAAVLFVIGIVGFIVFVSWPEGRRFRKGKEE
ncbi:hypothetical protein KY312_01865 [Candidatus Woesearchaeota archaeon]|nr:hypothetical protein [Candidatus Woesearchaeota archaeon]